MTSDELDTAMVLKKELEEEETSHKSLFRFVHDVSPIEQYPQTNCELRVNCVSNENILTLTKDETHWIITELKRRRTHRLECRQKKFDEFHTDGVVDADFKVVDDE